METGQRSGSTGSSRADDSVGVRGGSERLGLFGGSFDPIHLGHVAPVRTALGALQLDRVVYLPTARPPHKRGREFVDAPRRFAMVELALLDDSRLEVDDFEMAAHESYTVDTVRAFAPGRQLYLFLGADSLQELDQWREWREIVERCDLVVLQRPGFSLEHENLPRRLREVLSEERLHVVDHPLWSISSTELRRSLRHSGALTGETEAQVSPRVLQYIRKYGLYGARRSAPESPKQRSS